MDTVDIVGLAALLTYSVFLVTEKLWPARSFPERRGWQWIGLVFLALIGTISTVVPLLIPEGWLDAHRWLDGRRLGVVGGTIVGFVVAEGLVYAYHRSAHRVGFLWRTLHQVHHSPRRVDIPGSVLFHPAEMFVFASISTVVTTLVPLVAVARDPQPKAIVNTMPTQATVRYRIT